MSQRGYFIRREEKSFQASSWEQLCDWASSGRVKPDDDFMTPESSQWRQVKREPTLSILIPHSERLLLKRGDQTYKAQSNEMLQEWAAKGQVSPDDLVYSTYTQLWTRVSDLPSLMNCIPELVHEKMRERQIRRHNVSLLTPHQSHPMNASNDHDLLQDESESVVNDSKSTHYGESTDSILQLSAQSLQQICAPLYDTARLFIVIKELRPLDRLNGECKLSSLHIDCQGMNKHEALTALRDGLISHQREFFPDETSARSIGALSVYEALHDFLNTLDDGLPHVGHLDESRFVVGNQNRPKMSAEESTLMINLHSCIEQMISAVRNFKR